MGESMRRGLQPLRVGPRGEPREVLVLLCQLLLLSSDELLVLCSQVLLLCSQLLLLLLLLGRKVMVVRSELLLLLLRRKMLVVCGKVLVMVVLGLHGRLRRLHSREVLRGKWLLRVRVRGAPKRRRGGGWILRARVVPPAPFHSLGVRVLRL